MKIHTKHLDSFIRSLYFNDDVTHGELAIQLKTTPSSLSNRIKGYQTIEPPIFIKKKVGRSRIYHLTEYGKEYYEQKLAKADLEFAKLEQKKERISNILSNYDTCNYLSDKIGIAFLREIDVEVIAKTFDFDEFKFLALNFGLLGDYMSLKEAFNHTTVFDKTSKKQMAWGNNVYKKYKDLVLNNLDEETIDKYLPNGIQKSLFFRTYK